MSLTEESGPSQDKRTERDFPRQVFLGTVSTDTVLRVLNGFKKFEAFEVKLMIWGFREEGLAEREAIEEEEEDGHDDDDEEEEDE